MLTLSLGSSAQASNARFVPGPDGNLPLLLKTIGSAKTSVAVNIYQFDTQVVVDALIAKIKSGVAVEILLEGEPLGGVSTAGKRAIQQIHDAMKSKRSTKNKLYIMSKYASAKKKRRFVYNHAKYVIADRETTHVTSENFTSTGHAMPGTVGNRGWDIAIDDSKLAAQFRALFDEDTDVSQGDVYKVSNSGSLPAWFLKTPTAQDEVARLLPTAGDATLVPVVAPTSITTKAAPKTRASAPYLPGKGTIDHAELFVSPDSLRGLGDFMRGARETLEVQFMSMPSEWKESGTVFVNPIVATMISAAGRGVAVRALLNDDRAFGSSSDPLKPKGNEITAGYIQDIADCYGLPIESRIVDVAEVDITYIHNKGMIADGENVLVSSINGTRNSVINNRETAVALQSTDAAEYFGSVFDSDWELSKHKTYPLAQNRVGCPPLPGAKMIKAPFSTPKMGWLQ